MVRGDDATEDKGRSRYEDEECGDYGSEEENAGEEDENQTSPWEPGRGVFQRSYTTSKPTYSCLPARHLRLPASTCRSCCFGRAS